jgi:hypothetical protein
VVGFLSVLFVVAVVAGLIFQRTWRAVRVLRNRMVMELSQLKSKLRIRHLIISHLVDSLPSSFPWQVDREQITAARRRAEEALGRIDLDSPQDSDVCTYSSCEQILLALVEDLTARIEADDRVSSIDSVAACVQGLQKARGEIIESVSTYNTAAIAYSTYLESSRIARLFSSPEFALCDLDPPGSGVSRAEYVES